MGKRGNGEGSITRRKDGLYMARYTVRTPTGPKRKTLYGKTRREVDEKRTKAKADRDQGLLFEEENVTIAEYFDKWLKNSVRGSVRRSTFDCYEVICWRHIIPALGGMKLSRLTSLHVQEFYWGRLDSGLAS